MKKSSVKILSLIMITVFLFGNLNFNFRVYAENYSSEEPVISSMVQYKDMDYGFLKTFNFGEDAGENAVITFNTAEELKSSTDLRLKNDAYIKTNDIIRWEILAERSTKSVLKRKPPARSLF